MEALKEFNYIWNYNNNSKLTNSIPLVWHDWDFMSYKTSAKCKPGLHGKHISRLRSKGKPELEKLTEPLWYSITSRIQIIHHCYMCLCVKVIDAISAFGNKILDINNNSTQISS